MHNYPVKKLLIRWYENNKRDLPWRNKLQNKRYDPYLVLVSEIMLQQTTVPTVARRYLEFINKWPTVRDLSKASESQILKFWSGLGYYRRALNLLKCAKILNSKYKCIIPHKYEDLSNLPGIGRYTAKAIQGIVFNKPVIAIDANIERVVTRINGLSKPKNLIKKEIESFSEKLIFKKRPGDMIQALMDFGSLVCKPRNPVCQTCCINSYCKAYKNNLVDLIPLKSITLNKPIKYACAYIIQNDKNNIFLRRRSSKGMLPSMLEVPTSEWLKKPLLKKQIHDYSPLKVKYKKINKNILYSFSHFDLQINIYTAFTKKKLIKNGKWYLISKINSVELPTVMKKVIKLYIKNI